MRAVLYLNKQGLPIRGDVEDLSNKNPGNYLALLKEYAATDKILIDLLNSPRAINSSPLHKMISSTSLTMILFCLV